MVLDGWLVTNGMVDGDKDGDSEGWFVNADRLAVGLGLADEDIKGWLR